MTDIKIGNIQIEKWNYMSSRYKNQGYGAHSQAIKINDLTLFFSYDTVIAFYWNNKHYFSENQWGTTTGKHLNHLEGTKEKRIKRDIFEKLLSEALRDFKWHQLLEQ